MTITNDCFCFSFYISWLIFEPDLFRSQFKIKGNTSNVKISKSFNFSHLPNANVSDGGWSPTYKNEVIVTETVYSLRHYLYYPSTVCIVTYGAVQKYNPVILWLQKEKSTAAFKTASDPHAANKVSLFKVVVNSSYGELYHKNNPL